VGIATMPGNAAPAAGQPLLAMRGITKRFPGVVANDGVDFSLRAGEVHALLGENGAGKSTLMKVLYGMQVPDAGEILLDGEPVELHSPQEAIAAGIGMIHQHFMLVPTLTVAENLAIGEGGGALRRVDIARVTERIGELSAAYHLDVDPTAQIWQLAVGERQRVEILKVLARDARILVLDEPTAVLTPAEVDQLLDTLRTLSADGRGLVFISHKLHEVLALADRITVMRDGRVTGEVLPAATSRQQLADLMVGRPVKLVPDRAEVTPGEARLVLDALTVPGDRKPVAVEAADLSVRAGEVVGVAGVSGNGQRELAEAVAGTRPPLSGTISIDGHDMSGAHPRKVRAAGLAYVPEERMRDGAIADFTVAENLMLVAHAERPFSARGILRMGPIRARCRELVTSFAVRTPGLDTPTRTLSGGNIQKLIMAREMADAAPVVLVSQPTRGVDIGAAEYIHRRLMAARDAGAAILLISEDLDEILAMSDRVAVMFEGRIVAVDDRAACTSERLGLLMTGSSATSSG
jgi:simple sugar transport system ATP-binding protein